MRYEVTYRVAGEERRETIEADDAASAAAAARAPHDERETGYELILVQLVVPPAVSAEVLSAC